MLRNIGQTRPQTPFEQFHDRDQHSKKFYGSQASWAVGQQLIFKVVVCLFHNTSINPMILIYQNH